MDCLDKTSLRVKIMFVWYPKEEVMLVGERIRYLRKKRGWTLQQLADHIGLSQSLISMLERGEKEGSVQTLAKIADAFSISQGLLQEPSVDLEKLTEISEILENLSRLPPDQVEAVRQMVAALASSRP